MCLLSTPWQPYAPSRRNPLGPWWLRRPSCWRSLPGHDVIVVKAWVFRSARTVAPDRVVAAVDTRGLPWSQEPGPGLRLMLDTRLC